MNLRQILTALRCEGGDFEVGADLGALEREILTITDRPEQAGPQTLLVCPSAASASELRLPEADGVAALLVEKPLSSEAPVIRVRNARRAMGIILGALHRFPTDRLTATAVVGHRGKTVTALALASLLERADQPTGLVSSLMIKTDASAESGAQAVRSEDLYRLSARIAEAERRNAIIELPAAKPRIDEAAGLSFDLVLWAGGAEEPDVDLVPDLKERGWIVRLTPEFRRARSTASEPDPHSRLPAERILSIGSDGADFAVLAHDIHSLTVKPRDGLRTLSGGTVPAAPFTIQPRIAGELYRNAFLLAAAAGLLLGAEAATVSRAIAAFPGVFRRQQVLLDGPVTIVDDHAHDEAGLLGTLADLTTLKRRRILPVVAVAGGVGAEANLALGRALARACALNGIPHAKVVSCIGDAPPHARTNPEERAAFIAACRENGLSIDYYPFLQNGLDATLSESRPGDLIALLGGDTLDRAQPVLDEVMRAYPYLAESDPYDVYGSGTLIRPI